MDCNPLRNCIGLTLLILVSSAGQSRAAEALVDRVAAVLGEDIITLGEILELETYLRYHRDHHRAGLLEETDSPLIEEAYEEAITRKLMFQKLKSDPDFRLAQSRAREQLQQKIAEEGESTYRNLLAPYGLAVDRFRDLHSLTVAIQDYVRAKFRHAIVPTPIHIKQYIHRHAELEQRFDRLSEQGQAEVRNLIGKQLEFQNFMQQYERFVDELRAEVEILKVIVPETP